MWKIVHIVKIVFMKWLLMILRLVYKIYFLVLFILSLIVLFPIMYYLLINTKRFPAAFKMIRWHARILLFFAGVRLRITGMENIPKTGAYIICPNHSSFLDIFCVYSIFERYFIFTGKKEIEKWPLFKIYYTSGMNILVDRHNKTGMFKSFKRMALEIDKGNPLAIFPEGTISKRAPLLVPFKSGAFALAIQKQIPVLPVSFVTNWKLLQRKGVWSGYAGPGISKVIIHKPLPTQNLDKNDIETLQEETRKAIQRFLD